MPFYTTQIQKNLKKDEKITKQIQQLDLNNINNFTTIKKLGIYFAQQGKLFVCDKWGCFDDIKPKNFKEK